MAVVKSKNGKKDKRLQDEKNSSFHSTPENTSENALKEKQFSSTFKRIFVLFTCVKVLLILAYHSTDFEVHRNWLAITHTLPIREWYTNSKSQWTLDYPPFFAWFECLLSQIAVFFDPNMLLVDNLNYNSYATKVFQRGTVIATDCVFAFAIYKAAKQFSWDQNPHIGYVLLSLCNLGLLIVDHVHFQYNGFLLGILLLSILQVSNISGERQPLIGAFLFVILLNLKHIYLYITPAYIIWLLKWCSQKNFMSRFMKLATIVLVALVLSFGPFLQQLPQVFSRLFPFKRGLMHAYWAANFWALYAVGDKLLSFFGKTLKLVEGVKIASMTDGLVQEGSFTILPTPSPFATFVITFLSMTPNLYALAKQEAKPDNFLKSLVLCGFSSFMFGWHVHEKAILTIIFPLCILGMKNPENARIFLMTSSAGLTALFPLLHPFDLTPLKVIASILYILASMYILTRRFGFAFIRLHELLYLVILPFVTLYDTTIHRLVFHERLPFLPLAVTSMFCAVGVLYSFVMMYYDFLFNCQQIRRKTENVRVK